MDCFGHYWADFLLVKGRFIHEQIRYLTYQGFKVTGLEKLNNHEGEF